MKSLLFVGFAVLCAGANVASAQTNCLSSSPLPCGWPDPETFSKMLDYQRFVGGYGFWLSQSQYGASKLFKAKNDDLKVGDYGVQLSPEKAPSLDVLAKSKGEQFTFISPNGPIIYGKTVNFSKDQIVDLRVVKSSNEK